MIESFFQNSQASGGFPGGVLRPQSPGPGPGQPPGEGGPFQILPPPSHPYRTHPRGDYTRVFESDLEPGYYTGRLTSEEFHRRLADHFGVALPFPKFAFWWSDISDPLEGMAELSAIWPPATLSISCPTPTLCTSRISGKTLPCSIIFRASSCPLKWATANRNWASTRPSSGKPGSRLTNASTCRRRPDKQVCP